MIVYSFKNKYGRGIDREYPMGEAPAQIVVDGETFDRDYSVVRLGRTKDERFTSFSLPLKGSRYDTLGVEAKHYDKAGRPCFMNRQEAKEFAKKTEQLDGTYKYDD